MDRKPWTHSKCCRCGRSALHLSFLFWKMFHKTRWKKVCLRSALFSNMPDDDHVEIHHILSNFKSRPSMHLKACNKYMSGMQCSGALGRLGRHCRRTQSHHCHPAGSTAETFELNPFQPCATPICLPMGTAKEQGHGRKSYKVFSLNPLYQIEEDYWNICLNKSWGMNNPAILSPKVLNHTKFVAWQCIFLHSGLTLSHAFSLGHGFSIIKVLPTPDKRAQQRNKGMAEKHTKSSV